MALSQNVTYVDIVVKEYGVVCERLRYVLLCVSTVGCELSGCTVKGTSGA